MDYPLEQWINAPAGQHPVWDFLMIHAASWGQWIFLGVIVVWFLIGWVRGSARDRQGALTGLLAAGLALLANQAIHHIWTRPRPFVSHPATVHLLLRHSADPSFPSDHASAGFAVAFVLLAVHRRLGMLAVLFAALMSYARVYDGDHYPIDVLAGAVVGLIVAYVLLGEWLTPVMDTVRRLGDAVITGLRLPLPDGEAAVPSSSESRMPWAGE